MHDVEYWLGEIGEAAARLNAIDAIEGAAGNISVFLPPGTPGLDAFLSGPMPRAAAYELPGGDSLPRGVLLITGTGRRLRDAVTRSDAVLCAIAIDAGGSWLHRDPRYGVLPTSEIDSHIGIHAAILSEHDSQAIEAHAVIHAQPPHLTFLSHIPAYRDEHQLNRQLYRWQPETLVMLPEGIRVIPFETPGTPAQGTGTVAAMLRYRLVVWAKHGVVARSPHGPLSAADLIDYAEAAAHYEVLDLHAGRPADGLTPTELHAIAARFAVNASILDTMSDDLLA